MGVEPTWEAYETSKAPFLNPAMKLAFVYYASLDNYKKKTINKYSYHTGPKFYIKLIKVMNPSIKTGYFLDWLIKIQDLTICCL